MSQHSTAKKGSSNTGHNTGTGIGNFTGKSMEYMSVAKGAVDSNKVRKPVTRND